jgi:hypothetical protein
MPPVNAWKKSRMNNLQSKQKLCSSRTMEVPSPCSVPLPPPVEEQSLEPVKPHEPISLPQLLSSSEKENVRGCL